MATYDAVAVFGTRLQENNTFLPFVYQELDQAVTLVEGGLASRLIFCGSHWAGEGFGGVRECDVAEAYLAKRHAPILPYFMKEGRSTTVPENWLYMKLAFPDIRKIHLVTIKPLLPRMKFCGDWIYGDEGSLSFEALSWPATSFPHEAKLLQIMRCIFTVQNHKRRGDHTFLLRKGSGESCWEELWDAHGSCKSCFPM